MADEKKCFIIMPITTPEDMIETYRDGMNHFIHVLDCLFVPSVQRAGYEPVKPFAQGADLIHAEIIKNLEAADLVLCDMSCLNANVFFEFGIRTSLNKPVCVVKDELTKRVPFDTGILHHQKYNSSLDPWHLEDEIERLVEHISSSADRSKGENTLWKYFGLRTEAQPYKGEADPETKLDYLALQIESLQRKIDNSGRAVERESNRDFIPEKIVRELTKSVPGMVKLSYKIDDAKRRIRVEYSGEVDIEKLQKAIVELNRNYSWNISAIPLLSG